MEHFTGAEPIFIQIASQVREQILSGVLSEGDQVMSTNQYAQTFRINPATAGKAFALLVDEGLIEKRRGLGMFVREGAVQSLQRDGQASFVTDVLTPTIEQGLLLGITPASIQEHVHAILANATQPFAMQPQGDTP